MFHRYLRRGIIHPTSALLLSPSLLVAALLVWWWDRAPHDHSFGRFDGKVIAAWTDDERNMILQRDFAYIDARGKRWLAPTGSVINGASIPRIFWSAIGGPFEGKFRNASVIHDAACEAQVESWQAVHRMFYNAMRCSSVGEGKAQTMYWAVYHFGPRWHSVASIRAVNGEETVSTSTITEIPPSPSSDIVAKAERYFQKRVFTPAEIEACTVEDIENEVAKWDAAKNTPVHE